MWPASSGHARDATKARGRVADGLVGKADAVAWLTSLSRRWPGQFGVSGHEIDRRGSDQQAAEN